MVFKKLNPKLKKLVDQRFKTPTDIQTATIPEILSDNNLLAIAPTGLGKTESVFLPLMSKLLDKKHKPISLLYITPMRALNRDILDRLFWWCDKLDIEISVRHGDTTQTERAMQREHPPQILVTTPETVNAILPGKKLKEHLKNIDYVVIDEVHELVESKRGIQLSLILERLKRLCKDFQIIGISATVGSPKKVANFLGNNVKIIKADGKKKYDIKIELPEPKPEDKKIADQLFVGQETTARLHRIRELINKHKSVLTFTNTRQTAEIISNRFRSIDKKLKQDVHHGSLSKESRIKSEQDFKTQKLKALISTSSLELGIDIGSIDLVIQYLSPRQVSKLIQRVGRAGHGVGKTSKGILLTDQEDVFESAVIARKAMNKELEEVKMHSMALDALTTQIVGFSLDEYQINSETVFDTVKKAYPYKKLTKTKFYEVLRFLSKIRLVWLNPIYGKDKETPKAFEINRTKKGWNYYYHNLSMISNVRKVRVVSIIEGEPIGTLDESFVAEHGEPGNTFVVKGRAWRVVQFIGEDENKLIVEPVDDIESAIPAWEGELIPVPTAIAQEVGEIRNLLSRKKFKKIAETYPIDENSLKAMSSLIRKQSKKHIVPDNKNLLLESYKDFQILHSCNGTRTNNTIGRYIAAMLTNETGVSVNIKTDPYRIIFQTVANPKSIIRIIKEANNIEKVIEYALEGSSMFKWRFLQTAKKFGVIARRARFDKLSINKVLFQYMGTPPYKEAMRELFVDKMNIKGAIIFFNQIKTKKIKITVQKGLSPLGENGLVHHFSEVMKPKRPEGEIFEAFKRRLMHTRIRLTCTKCAYSVPKAVRDVEETPSCPKCLSGMLGITSKYKNPKTLVEKAIKKETLKTGEQKELKTLKRSASLMITYGKKYAIVQAGRGVGPETAARILSKIPKNEEHLLKLIFEAEKTWQRTRIYWN